MFMNESTNCESLARTRTQSLIFSTHRSVMDKFSNSRGFKRAIAGHRFLQLILKRRISTDARWRLLDSDGPKPEGRCVRGRLRLLKTPLAKMEDIVKLPDNQIAVVCTGSQGEFNAVFKRIV